MIRMRIRIPRKVSTQRKQVALERTIPTTPTRKILLPTLNQNILGLGAGRYSNGDGRGKARSREADEVSCLQFAGRPVEGWARQRHQVDYVGRGSPGRSRAPWIMKCETDEPSALHDPGEEWVALDRKIAAALTRICHGEIGRAITQMTTMSLNSNRIVRGRVLVGLCLSLLCLRRYRPCLVRPEPPSI